MKKVLVICGPTATGKTVLGIKLAKKFNGEMISADSRQIYRGMNIGTGKELPAHVKFKIENLKFGQRRNFRVGYYIVGGVGVWLYDVVAPDQPFSAADYRQIAWPVMEDIWRRGKLPLVVGGTGFYIKSLLRGFDSEGIPPDWALRKQLGRWTAAQLARRLRELSPARWGRMNESDRQNPRRLIRAIELGSRVQRAGFRGENKKENVLTSSPYALPPLYIGLTAPHPYLYQRIDQRVEEMMGEGLLAEVEDLVQRYGWTAPGLNGIGYRQFCPYFEGKESLAVCVQKVKYATHAYARRQMTWFKREPDVVWFDVSQPGFDEQALKLVKSFR